MIVFKGPGFYSTDNKRSLRGDQPGSGEGSSSPPEVSESDSESTTSDSKGEKQEAAHDSGKKKKSNASQLSPGAKSNEGAPET